MKKILLILSALLLTAVGASAQVTDVTATYIKNASFEDDDVSSWTVDEKRASGEEGSQTGAWIVTSLMDWTLTDASNFDVVDIMTADATETDNDLGTPGEAADGTYMLYLKKTWANSLTAAVAQTITLPAGTYMLTVDSKCFSGGSSANLVAGSASNAITINGTSGGNASNNSYPMTELTEWTTNELTFTVTPEEGEEEAEVEIGVKFTLTNTSPGSFVLDNFKLYSINYKYDITELLSNPSFELDDVSDLEADSGRGYAVTELTGWTLNGPNGDNAHKDIMTSASTATDNNYGVPGDPSEGNQMLYLRDAWAANTGSVMQSIVLPAGEYKVTVDTKCAAGDPTAHSASLVVNEESTALTIHAKGTSTDETTAAEPFVDGWDTAGLEFVLTETTEVSLGVQLTFGAQQYGLAVILDNFQLFSVEDVEAIDFNYDVTWELANPSFEVDKVAYLTEDETRSTSEEGVYTSGAYTIGNGLTGWTLGGNNAVSDLMTEDCQRTDNNFGAPGTPTDGTQMLYLRNNATTTSSVEQTITLPAGEYMLTVDSKCVSTGGSTAKLVAGEKSAALTIHTESSIPSVWDTAELILSLDAETEVTIGVDISYTGNGSFLLDNFKLYSVEAIEKTISWEMTEAGWGTMILPFAATLADGLTAYSCNGTTTDEETETTTVDLTEVGQSITANTPYIIKCTDDNAIKAHEFTGTPTNEKETYTEGILTGTLVDLAVAKGAAFATDGTMYVLQYHVDETTGEEVDDGLAFYPIIAATEDAENSSEATLDAYHCYLDLSLVTTSARPVALHFPGSGEATAIVAVESETLANDAIYDLSGRRVSKAVKGVYIQNGKKVLVK